MKKYLYILTAFVVFLSSCEKETEGISKETEFAVLTMNGPEFSSIVKGGTFTDPGVIAKEGDTELDVNVAGQVNPNVVGIYELVYSAVNQDGYPGSVKRTVAVIPGPETGPDLSGSYGMGTANATITKYSPGFYRMSNIFSGSSIIPVYILTSDGKNLILPEASLSGFGPVNGTGVVNGSVINFIINLTAQSAAYQNFPRNWTKK